MPGIYKTIARPDFFVNPDFEPSKYSLPEINGRPFFPSTL